MTIIADKLRNVREFIVNRQCFCSQIAATCDRCAALATMPDPDRVMEIPDPGTMEVSPELAEHSRKIRPFVLHPDETHTVIEWARGGPCPDHICAALAKLEAP